MNTAKSVWNFVKNLAAMPRLVLRSDPVDYYRYLGDDVVEGEAQGFQDPHKPLWLNLGYWEKARTYPEAASAMAHQLGAMAELGPTDRLLDVGFGFAEQDFYWLEQFNVAHITGLNITPMQVERARQRVEERHLGDRMDLRVGSATQVPFGDGSFTKVTALECAHHFVTREQFFREAFRVLEPGGRLALADGLPQPGHQAPNLLTKLVLRRWASPVENFYDRHVYQRKLEACGFTNVVIKPIGPHVFPATLQYSALRRAGRTIEQAVVPELGPTEIATGLARWALLSLNDYVLVRADKPRK
jgi:microcystin synthetase protein McyJ